MARLKLSIVLNSSARIGPGKAKLLESIRDTGSISAAAREMGMYYKRAWLLLDSINQAFEIPAVTAAVGDTGAAGRSSPISAGSCSNAIDAWRPRPALTLPASWTPSKVLPGRPPARRFKSREDGRNSLWRNGYNGAWRTVRRSGSRL